MFTVSLAAAARDSDAFRRVLTTTDHTQVVLMTLAVGEDIGAEVHEENDQLLLILEGRAAVVVGGDDAVLSPGDLVVVPAGSEHNVTNDGDIPLRLCTVYGPPDHADDAVHLTKADAESAEESGEDVPHSHG